MLSRLGLEFPRRRDVWHQREMNVKHIFAPKVPAKFANGFEKRQAFDIANRAADLDDAKVVALGGQQYTPLDFVGNVRNHLDGCAKVVAPPLLLNDGVVDLTGSAVIKTAGGV